MTLIPGDFKVEGIRGRVLAVNIVGAADGYPVFLMHGTPGSRLGPKPRGILLHRLGLKLISYDRPGYGGSDRHEGRLVADAADDVAVIARELRIHSFAVVGRSGGGPHALATAALLPRKVSHVAALVSLAPYDADGLNWYGGMNEHNVQEYSTADADTEALLHKLKGLAADVHKKPHLMIEQLRSELSEFDHTVVGDVAMRRLLLDTYREGLQQGPLGWIDDVLAFRKPWKFDFADIVARALFWHGADDQFSPVEHSSWLHERVPGSKLHIQSNIGHFGAVEVLPNVLSWIADGILDKDTADGRVKTDPADRSPGRRGALPVTR